MDRVKARARERLRAGKRSGNVATSKPSWRISGHSLHPVRSRPAHRVTTFQRDIVDAIQNDDVEIIVIMVGFRWESRLRLKRKRLRISSILESSEGKRNPAMAQKLALYSALDAETAKSILAEAPTAANPYLQAMEANLAGHYRVE